MYLIFDIETVSDYALWTPPSSSAPAAEPPAADAAPAPGPTATEPTPLALVPAPAATPPKKSRARKKDPANPGAPPREPFAPLYAQRPIAIAMMLFNDEFQLQNVAILGPRQYPLPKDEPTLLRMWSEYLYTSMPALVTFGGRHFDMPVLSLRGLRHGIAMRWLTQQVRHRYGEEHHIDLCDSLTEFGAVNKTGFTLDTLSRVCGLPGKTTDGADVSNLYKAGHFDKVEMYCLSDVFRTTILFLRHRVMRGLMSVEAYRTVVTDLMEKATTWSLGSVTFGVDMPRLMLEG